MLIGSLDKSKNCILKLIRRLTNQLNNHSYLYVPNLPVVWWLLVLSIQYCYKYEYLKLMEHPLADKEETNTSKNTYLKILT